MEIRQEKAGLLPSQATLSWVKDNALSVEAGYAALRNTAPAPESGR